MKEQKDRMQLFHTVFLKPECFDGLMWKAMNRNLFPKFTKGELTRRTTWQENKNEEGIIPALLFLCFFSFSAEMFRC